MLCANCGDQLKLNSTYYRAGKNGSPYCSVNCSYEAYENYYTKEEVNMTLEKMAPVKKYECTVGCTDRVITVPVYTASEDKEVIKKLAIKKTEEHLQEFDIPYSKEDIVPACFVNCGSFEVMPNDENI